MFKKFLFIMTGVLLTAASTTNASYVVGYRIPVNSAADSLNIIIEAASTKTNYNYYVSETANNECHWQLGFSQNSVWTLEQTDATHYYIRNLASGRYIGPCPKTSGSTAKTVEEKADAAMFVFYSQATSPTSWTDYDNQTRFPRGWDDSSWMIYDTSASYAWRNDAGAQAAGNLYYGNGSHICMWNVYTAVEREETIPTADVFDMQFGANGAATDLSTMQPAAPTAKCLPPSATATLWRASSAPAWQWKTKRPSGSPLISRGVQASSSARRTMVA